MRKQLLQSVQGIHLWLLDSYVNSTFDMFTLFIAYMGPKTNRLSIYCCLVADNANTKYMLFSIGYDDCYISVRGGQNDCRLLQQIVEKYIWSYKLWIWHADDRWMWHAPTDLQMIEVVLYIMRNDDYEG